MQTAELYKIYQQHPSVQTDTRKLKQGDLFFALKGENFNGNLFAEKALEAGAAYAIVDEEAHVTGPRTILVPDVLTALQDLAGHHRSQLTIPVIGITGSNGKTTTKEMIHVVLSAKYRTSTTEGNLNNHIGIPLTLLRIPMDAEMAVVEMGANHQREIAEYCRYANPGYGLITNAGKAHLEGFGGVEGVRKGKGELFDHLRSILHGVVFIYADYDYLQEMSKGISGIISYGTLADAPLQGSSVDGSTFLKVRFSKGFSAGDIQTQLVGAYNLPNILAAVCIGQYFGVPDQDIRAAIEAYAPSNSRSQLLQSGSNQVILDAYNANPSSMKFAIENLAKMDGHSKVLLLGAMAELGEESLDEHRAIAAMISEHQWKAVALVGGDFQRIEHPFLRFATATEAGLWFHAQDFRDSKILIKGSRSMQMEKLLTPP